MLENKSISEAPWQRRRLNVPKANEGLVAEPATNEAVQFVSLNHANLSSAGVNIQGRSLDQVRQWTRQEASIASRAYTSQLLGREIPSSDWESLVVTGHQPSMFHPGVWAKNFATAALADQTNSAALNLIVDNDAFDSTRIRVPTGTRNHPSYEMVPFDEPRSAQPWEDATIVNPELFESFGNRIAQQMAEWKIKPIVSQMWPHVLEQRTSSQRLVDCLSAGRAQLERSWGLTNWELPMSRLCQLDPFLWFASHLFASLGKFQETYNEVIRQYRQVNHVRSPGQPVPELEERDGWREAPFWVWNEGDLRRKRVFAKQTSTKFISLSDGDETFAELPLSSEMDACCAVEVLRELPQRGIRFRTRALTTTLFARLFLADLFVHGIGGAKYDEMTDRIISRFYGISAPPFATVSATLYLPFAKPFDVEPPEEVRLSHLLRDLTYNPDRHLRTPPEPACQELVAEKQELIAEQEQRCTLTVSQRAERRKFAPSNQRRFERFRAIDEQLSQCTSEFQQATSEELATIRWQLHANNIIKSREFSYCLYPEEKLRPFLTGLVSASE